MTDTVAAAWIAVGGTVLVAVVSVLAQLFTTRFVMKSERQKIAQQIEAEHRAQTLRRRTDILLESMADLLAETDPQVKAEFDYGRVVSLIHRAQLVLNQNDQEEAALNAAVNQLGLELQQYIPHHARPVQERNFEVKKLLGVHAKVATLAGHVVRR